MRRSLIPDIVNLQAFECAARHENFSRAAEELNLTQSAVSRQISDLEHQTGLKLFERVRRRVILSEAGHRLLPEVQELLVRSERLMIGALAAGNMSTSLKIATLPTFGAKWLVPRLSKFLGSYPDVAITVESRVSPFDFEDEIFDLAIHFGRGAWPGATSTFLCHETIIPVAGPTLAERFKRSGKSLDSAPLLHLTTRPKLWADWALHHQLSLQQAYRGVRFDQFSMITSGAIAGLGVALLPTYLIEAELASGQLVALYNLPMTTENAYYVVRPLSKRTQLTADAFESWLRLTISQQI